jgi:hypothetical protein
VSDTRPFELDDVPLAFAPFTAPEVQHLRAFRDLAREFAETTFAARKKHQFRIASSTKPVIDALERDVLKSAMGTYRKLFVLKKDPGTFNRVRGVLGRAAQDRDNDEARSALEWLSSLKQQQKTSRESSAWFEWVLELPDGSSEPVRPADTMKIATYGEVSHHNAEQRERWKKMGGWDNPAAVMQLTSSVEEGLLLCQHLDAVVDRILGEPSLLPGS